MPSSDTPVYPAKRFIRMMDVNGREQPAFAPAQEIDHLAAYASFLFMTKEEAEADQKDDIEVLAESRALEDDEELADDNFFEEDTVYECVIDENGTVTTDFNVLTREVIFRAFGVTDPAAAPQRSLR